jgi:hypothetical protein
MARDINSFSAVSGISNENFRAAFALFLSRGLRAFSTQESGFREEDIDKDYSDGKYILIDLSENRGSREMARYFATADGAPAVTGV